mgnify:FL=1
MKFIHLRPISPKNKYNAHGGITIAYQPTNPNEYKVAFALCSNKDNYCKRTGRDKATERFLQNKTLSLPTFNQYPDVGEVLDTIEEHINYTLIPNSKKVHKLIKETFQ